MAKKKAKRTGSRKAASKKTKSKRKPAARRRSGPKRARSAASAQEGPVTLEQAKALAREREPQRALRKSAEESVQVAPATPGTVRAERVKLARQQRLEDAQRIREYKAVLGIMKERGVMAPGVERPSMRRPRTAKREVVVTQPLQIFAEGDSWFDYPVPFFGGGIISRLERKLGVPILNLAKAGDEVRFMMGVEQRKGLAKRFTDGCPAGGSWDVLLFSGGGNDIVDNPMALWIKDYDPDVPPTSLLHKARFESALALIRAGYEDLIEMRNALSPGTQLVFHAYDFAIPDGRGICRMGPWMKPTFDLRKFPKRKPARAVVKHMLEQFARMLESLARRKGVTFINGQGTLAANTKSWHNELHPSKAGFKKFAKLFHKRLKAQFPDRVI